MFFSRTAVIVAGLMSLLLISQSALCGPVFDRVMKAGVLRLGLPYNVVPQGFLKKDGTWVGFEVDIGSTMAKHMNLKVQPVKVNHKTWRTMLSNGQIDAALCRIRHTRSLDAVCDFSVPYFFDSLHVMTLKGAYKSAADLKGLKIAAIQGSSAEKAAMRLLSEAGDPQAQQNVISFPRPTFLLRCFRAGQGLRVG